MIRAGGGAGTAVTSNAGNACAPVYVDAANGKVGSSNATKRQHAADWQAPRPQSPPGCAGSACFIALPSLCPATPAISWQGGCGAVACAAGIAIWAVSIAALAPAIGFSTSAAISRIRQQWESRVGTQRVYGSPAPDRDPGRTIEFHGTTNGDLGGLF